MPFFMEQYFIYNGQLFPADSQILTPASRAFRFGESLFETIRLEKRSLHLFQFHLDRLFDGMKILGFECPTAFNREFLTESILRLADVNGIANYGRVRLTISKGETSMNSSNPSKPDWIIECNTLPEHYLGFNESGYSIDIDDTNTKGSGPLSNLKSGNYLLYILAAQRAKELQVNECLVLNSAGRIADSSIFNIFLIRNKVLYTPSLLESPVAGVMRRFLINYFHQSGHPVMETAIKVSDLEQADELFLTNALYGIRWVHSFRSSNYGNHISRQIYHELFEQKLYQVV